VEQPEVGEERVRQGQIRNKTKTSIFCKACTSNVGGTNGKKMDRKSDEQTNRADEIGAPNKRRGLAESVRVFRTDGRKNIIHRRSDTLRPRLIDKLGNANLALALAC